jgi:hypothetical protein
VTGTLVTNYPTSVAEAHAALGFGVFDHGWLCDDPSGNMAPAFGGLTLVAGGTGIIYGDPGPINNGAVDKTLGFGAPRTGKFDGGQAFDVGAGDDLLVAWVGMWRSLPSAFGSICGKVTATFTNGWAVAGRDGTAIGLGLGPGDSLGVSLLAFGAAAYHVGSWHVGIAAIDRSVGRACIGTRSVTTGTAMTNTSGSIDAQSVSTAASFSVGSSAWVPANDNFRLAALFIGKSVGAATGLPANVATALQNFHTYVTRSDNYKAKVMRRQLPPPYKQDFGATIPAILTVIGQSDNLIGGLFGSADFLPDEG